MAKSLFFRSIRSVLISHTRSTSHYVTTPIFYVNSSPHIGHVHTLFLADALNIYHRLKCNTKTSIFSTGTDEHGIKIQTAANAAGKSCREFCNTNSMKFHNLFEEYETTITDFIRTTEERHVETVKKVWTELHKGGFIYKCCYEGWYSVSDEVFVPDSSVTEKEIGGQTTYVDQNDNKLVWSSEENYMFRIDMVREKVMSWLQDEKPILPERFNNEAIRLISDTKDFSISRPRDRLEWGIPVPNDPSQTIYVWVDALTNYLTTVGYGGTTLRRWPIDCQVLGKDILRFHAIYWPGLLAALSLQLPKKMICHSHWLVDATKMSKSKGNVVDPWNENKLLTKEGLRYYLLRCSTPHSDNDYNQVQALRTINSELAGTYGNLVNRCCSLAINPKQVVPRTMIGDVTGEDMRELVSELDDLISSCSHHFEKANFYKGIGLIMAVLRSNHAIYQRYKPWELVKDMETNPESHRIHNNVQAVTFETIRICSILLQPIVPKLASQSLQWLNQQKRAWSDAHMSLAYNQEELNQIPLVKDPQSVLFRKLKVE